MLPIFGMILAGIIGYAISQSKKGEEPKQLPGLEPKALPPIEVAIGKPKITGRRTSRHPKVQKSFDDLLVAAVQHAFVTHDPRDYRAAAGLAIKANKPESSKVLAERADERAKQIAVEAKGVLEAAVATRDPRQFERYAALVEQIDQADLARKARVQASVLRGRRTA